MGLSSYIDGRSRASFLASLVLLALLGSFSYPAHASGDRDAPYAEQPVVRLEADASGFAGILPKEAGPANLSRPTGPEDSAAVPECSVASSDAGTAERTLSVRRMARRRAEQPLYCLHRAYLI